MLIYMRTTFNIDEKIMHLLKRRAAETGVTMTAIIENSLKQTLVQKPAKRSAYRFKWKTVRGRVLAGVDLADRDSLIDRMEGRG
jgi:Ribbon-helix-helix protein, copG family